MSKKKIPAINRRKFARIPFTLEVKIIFDDINTFVSELSADLSVGGMFIKTNKPRKVGTPARVSMKLQNGMKLVEASGKVARIVLPGDSYTGAQPGMAIQFTQIDPESRRTIEQYIEKHSK